MRYYQGRAVERAKGPPGQTTRGRRQDRSAELFPRSLQAASRLQLGPRLLPESHAPPFEQAGCAVRQVPRSKPSRSRQVAEGGAPPEFEGRTDVSMKTTGLCPKRP